MLDECLEYLEKKSKNAKFAYEVIIVSDGSTDKTVEIAQKYSKKYSSENMRILALETNRGKGGAVRLVSKSKFNIKRVTICNTFKKVEAKINYRKKESI